jgi:nucleoside-diphosphate-sugar epimerase
MSTEQSRTALVGYTGFVGSNLVRSRDFDVLVNSSNVADLAGQHFSRVVFSAAKAEKWKINQNPEADLEHIEELERILSSFTTDELVLISTVDVYKDPSLVDETTAPETEGLHPYGAHRLRLEKSARALHPVTSVVRLPALYGPGLKKNVIFDLLNDNNVQNIHHGGHFQYYNLERLADDLDRIVTAGLPLVNIATEPVLTSEIAEVCFDLEFDNAPEGVRPGSYDMRTVHAEIFGGSEGYAYRRDVVLAELSEFVAQERNGRTV